MRHSPNEVKLKAADILMSTMQHDVVALRTFLYQQVRAGAGWGGWGGEVHPGAGRA